MASTLIRLRYPGRCAGCDASLPPGDRAYYDRATRKAHCQPCGQPAAATVPVNIAGGSARREYERRRDAREARIREAVPIVGGIVARLSEPQHQVAWARGAEGERRGAAALAKLLDGHAVLLLHDRRRPGTKANLDHLAVGPGGVTVIDSKLFRGRIRVQRKGLFRPEAELRVAGRRRTKLVDGVQTQVLAVRDALAGHGLGSLEVRGALQFIDPDLPLFGGLSDIREVVLGTPRRVAKLARRPGPLTAEQIRSIASQLDSAFPAA